MKITVILLICLEAIHCCCSDGTTRNISFKDKFSRGVENNIFRFFHLGHMLCMFFCNIPFLGHWDNAVAMGSEVPLDTSLNTYLRYYCKLTGTKSMCHEGGCGSCVISLSSRNVFTKQESTYAANSCLIPVFSCHGRAVVTVEGIGSKRQGYNVVQSRLAEHNGTQCGYCSPGMVMNMYSLLQRGNITMQEVEDSFDGNLCRCTGYRPILDAFKTLSVDAPENVKAAAQDIEDLVSNHSQHVSDNTKSKNVKKCANQLQDKHKIEDAVVPVHIFSKGLEWYKVATVEEVFRIFDRMGDVPVPYMLVAGNTAHGVYSIDVTPRIFIDIQDIFHLKRYEINKNNLMLGANMVLFDVIKLFQRISKQRSDFSYLERLADHLLVVANVPVRNIGTIAGNLMTKHNHNDFPSDVFLLFETVGANLKIATRGKVLKDISLLEFLDLDMKHKVILSVTLPALPQTYRLKTYKIRLRYQNAHAHVNAGFLYKWDTSRPGFILERPRIVYGGINPQFVHASRTEDFLTHEDLFNPAVFKRAVSILETEINPDVDLPNPSPVYRKRLALGLFYKCVLYWSPPNLPRRLLSGGNDMIRPLSTAKQDFETHPSEWPVNQPIMKINAYEQCGGETKYINDIPTFPGEAYAAMVITTVGQGTLSSINPAEALKIPGVITFLSAKDIPGTNTINLVGYSRMDEDEELFCSGQVKYSGQPVGIVVAESWSAALHAAQKVKLTYSNVHKPKLHIREVLESADASRIRWEQRPPRPTLVKQTGSVNVTHEISGKFDLGSQYHFFMETHVCICVPIENGLDVHTACQWMDNVQVAIARALNMKQSQINIKVGQVGGGYGGKITRNCYVSTACALAARLLNRPVRFVLDLVTLMKALGKRCDFAMDYLAKTDANGKILQMKVEMYENVGSSWNEYMIPAAYNFLTNCYDDSTWVLNGYSVKTDVPSTTWCRGPGALESISAIENIMDHIARVVQKDPMEVRLANMAKGENPIPELIQQLKKKADYGERKRAVDVFNQTERWKKKGMAIVPMTYGIERFGCHYLLLSVHATDGSVTVTHGGPEIGQGISTKVTQVIAFMLKIPLQKISVKPSIVFTAPNDIGSVASISSDSACFAAMTCCRTLLQRMEPARQGLHNPSWQEWVTAANDQCIDLCVTHMYPYGDSQQNYSVYGVTAVETIIDLLTGECQIVRVDLLEDAGVSISPLIDIGQIEGSFIMGLGYYLFEYLVYDQESGELLTNRTWNYKIPGFKDIPVDFRVYVLRNSPNPSGVLRSKATGEPPLVMSCSIYLAIRNALHEARKEAGLSEDWFPMKYRVHPHQ